MKKGTKKFLTPFQSFEELNHFESKRNIPQNAASKFFSVYELLKSVYYGEKCLIARNKGPPTLWTNKE